MKNRASVTKRDVLVVLGCIVFVLANLGAVGSTGRRRAREAVCLSNLLKWGVVWKSYADDHDGYFADRTDTAYWPGTAQKYYRNARLLLCPEAARTYIDGGLPPFAAWVDDIDLPGGGEETMSGSYTVNLWMATTLNMPVSRDLAKFWQTPYTKGCEDAPLLMDGNWSNSEPECYDEAPPYDGYWWEPNRNEIKRVCINRHYGAVNGLFLDFSAGKTGLKQLWRLRWHRKWRPDAFPDGGWPEWMQNFRDY